MLKMVTFEPAAPSPKVVFSVFRPGSSPDFSIVLNFDIADHR
jgi:hypothetical protein